VSPGLAAIIPATPAALLHAAACTEAWWRWLEAGGHRCPRPSLAEEIRALEQSAQEEWERG
jgi:hypothetical protein